MDQSSDQLATTWLDVFPWIGTRHSSDQIWGTEWWYASVGDASVTERHTYIAAIVDLAIKRNGSWPIGELFPALPDIPLRTMQLPTRAQNVMGRIRAETTADLTDITTDELLALRGMGVGSAEALLVALADAATVPLEAQVARSEDEVDHDSSVNDAKNEPIPRATWLNPLTRDLEALAEWYATVGLPGRSLMEPPPAGSPQRIHELRERLARLTSNDVLGGDDSIPTVADHLEATLWTMDERARTVLGARLFADQPVTLDSIGQQFGITRERVRQIESRARARLTAAIEADTMLGQIAEAARREVWMLRPLADLLRALPGLGAEVRSVGQPAWRVLDRLDDAYEIEDGWCAVPTISAAKEETRNYLEDLSDEFGVVSLDSVDVVFPQGEPRPSWIPEWLTFCGYEIQDAHVMTRMGSVNDLAAGVLAINGAPLKSTEILERFTKPRSIGSLRNALGSDARFRRVNVDTWSLTTWEMTEYSSIREEIAKSLAERGGIALIGDLVEELTERFSVSPNSVVAYASAHPYRLKDGVVMELGSAHQPSRGPESTKGYYRREGAWSSRMRVSQEHLRGSGFPASKALESILGLKPEGRMELPSPQGPQSVYWTGLQPQVGTIRRFLQAMDAGVGDEVFLLYFDDGGFDVEGLDVPVEGALGQALRLVGGPIDATGSEAASALADAIGLGVRRPSTIEAAYRSRGDTDVADLIAAAFLDDEPASL